jgi:hypothetical protein
MPNMDSTTTSIEPVTAGLDHQPQNIDVIAGVRQLIMAMDDRRAELAEAGDVDNLAHGAADVDLLIGEFSVVKRQAQADIAKVMAEADERKREVPGLGVVEVKGGFDRKNWESGKVLHRVIMEAIVDKETGEIHSFDSPTAFATAVENNIRACLGMTGSTAWKVGERKPDGTYKGGLRSLDIDPTDYCDEIERPQLAIIPKRKVTS